MRDKLIELIESLRSRGAKVTEINKWAQYLRSVWKQEFANHLSDYEKREINLDHFLWHLFSYKKVNCFENENAKSMFNVEGKKDVYLFFQHYEIALIVENVELINANEFDNYNDIYIVDKKLRWTYIQTHESQCGPYFFKR